MIAPSTALSMGSLILLSQLSSSHLNNIMGCTALGTQQSHPIPLPSLHVWEGSSFPGLVPPDDMVDSESVLGLTPGNSGVVIAYQVDEITCIWSVEWFVTDSHIYPGFTGNVS